MLIIKSDYSPHAAQDLQEADNVKALRMLIQLSGISPNSIEMYHDHASDAAKAYEEALSLFSKAETEERYKKANEASKASMDKAEKILANYGVCIKNKLVVSDNKDFFSHIATTLHIDYADSTPVACIERAVIDIESKSYEDNSFGYQL